MLNRELVNHHNARPYTQPYAPYQITTSIKFLPPQPLIKQPFILPNQNPSIFLLKLPKSVVYIPCHSRVRRRPCRALGPTLFFTNRIPSPDPDVSASPCLPFPDSPFPVPLPRFLRRHPPVNALKFQHPESQTLQKEVVTTKIPPSRPARSGAFAAH